MSLGETADDVDDRELEGDIEACRLLTRRAGLSGDVPAIELVPLRARVEGQLASETGWLARLRALRTGQRLALVLALVLLLALLVAATTPRADLGQLALTPMMATLGVLTAATALAAWRLLRPLHAPPPHPWASRALLVVGVLTPCVLAFVPGHQGAGAAVGEGAAFMASCGKCLGFGGVLGLPVLLLALWARRAQTDGAAVAALGGVAAGLAGNVTLQLHCPITEPLHVLVGHATLLVLLGAVAVVWQR